MTIQPALINNERLKFYIEQLLVNPAIERPAKPLEDAMAPVAQRS